jgi:hypothetical protein
MYRILLKWTIPIDTAIPNINTYLFDSMYTIATLTFIWYNYLVYCLKIVLKQIPMMVKYSENHIAILKQIQNLFHS